MSLLKMRYCPCCNNFSRKFTPLSDEYIVAPAKAGLSHPIEKWETLNYKEYWCPKCGASDRDRFMSYFLQQHTELISQKSVIEFAPSTPITNRLKSLKPKSYFSVDKYMPNVDIPGDLTDLKEVKSSTTDFWICSHVLEHIQEDSKALSELHRILSLLGTGLLLVPISLFNNDIIEDDAVIDPAERLRQFGQDDHVRIYDHKGLVRRAKEAGFKISFYDAAKELNVFKRIFFGITKTSRLYLLKKQ